MDTSNNIMTERKPQTYSFANLASLPLGQPNNSFSLLQNLGTNGGASIVNGYTMSGMAPNNQPFALPLDLLGTSNAPQEDYQAEAARELGIADGSQPAQTAPVGQSPQPSASDVAGAVTQEAVTRATNDPQAGAVAGSVATAAASNVGTDAQGTQTAQPAQTPPNLAQGLLGSYASPAARYFDEQLAGDYQKQLDAALLPARIAQYDANEAAIRRAYPDTVMGAKRQIVEGLSQAKAAYDNAKAAGNEKGMNLAHQAAEQLRAQAQAIGLDLGDYGGNEDTNAMVQALANNDARAYAAVIDNDLTPEQYYQRLYNQARNDGLSRRGAEKYAQGLTENYQAERNARMQSAFYTYGIQNGAITPYGMQILTKWAAGEDPQAFLGIATKAFGLPIDEYKLGNQRTLLSDQNKNAIQQLGVKHQANMEEIGFKGQIEARIHQLDGEIKKAQMAQDFQQKRILVAEKAQLENYYKAVYGTGPKGSSSSGGGSRGGGSGKGGWKTSDAKNAIAVYNKWNADHPDQPESANPFREGYEKAMTVINDNNPENFDPDDYDSMSSHAQDILEENYREGYPYTAEQLAQIISSAGGYGPQIAQEWIDKGYLSDYGANE